MQAVPLRGQSGPPSDPEPWNGPRARALIERAQAARRESSGALGSYRADAHGYVYFFIDQPDQAEHVLVKADQVALELFWKAPDRARQRLVGRRDEKVLPTRIRYHLDHLTVVQDDFGDMIRLGDGDEVSAVVHPVAPGAGAVYDYLLTDSLTLAYGVDGSEVRVYELRVRPKDMGRPGVIGSVYVDRARAAIVRMSFSFTPTSYVDDYLDHITISLDNSLWDGVHWLPYRQEIEIRREIPLLDFSSGSVIRTRFEIGGYDFETPIDDDLFDGTTLLAVSPARREAFPFDRGLFDEIDEEGLTVSTTMEEVRSQVREVAEEEVLSGLDPLRLSLDGLSDFARYNRAEGLYLGGGFTARPRGGLRARASAGYAFGRRGPSGVLRLTGEGERRGPGLSLYWDDVVDIGRNPGATPMTNTIGAASAGEDFLDPYFRRGVTAGRAVAGGPVVLSVAWERHRSAESVVDSTETRPFRPVRGIDDGDYLATKLSYERVRPARSRAALEVTAARLGTRSHLGATLDVDRFLGSAREGVHGLLSAQLGAVTANAPAQALFLLGGRHTIPGHPYRAYVGNLYALASAEGTVPIRPPYVGLRFFGIAAASHLSVTDLHPDWVARDTDGVRGSFGAGLSLGWDTLHLDVARGIRGSGWEAVFSVTERFRGWM